MHHSTLTMFPRRNAHLSSKDHPCMVCIVRVVGFLILSFKLIQKAECQVGVVYSPFVKSGDEPDSSAYSKNDVQVMLQLISEQGYQDVATYGMGAKAEKYRSDSTWKACSSIVHTANAAAEINKASNRRVLSVYQGMFYTSNNPEQLNSEIEVGFQMASTANSIFAGTVAAITFPSLTGFDSLSQLFQLLKTVSERTRGMGMKFGVRLWDCDALSKQDYKNNVHFRNLMGLLDYVICQRMPNFNDFTSGPEEFKKTVTTANSKVDKAIRDNMMGLPIKVILESGWPGAPNLNQQTTIENMTQFWNQMKNWAVTNNRQVFLLECFDNPWKRSLDSIFWGAHYGIFHHLDNDSSNSRDAYVLKQTLVTRRTDSTSGSTNSRGVSPELIFGIIFGLVLFTLLAVMITFLYRRVKRIQSNKLSQEDIRQFLDGIITNEQVDEDSHADAWRRAPYNKDFELRKNAFSIDKSVLLGSGAFGSVYKGKINGLVSEVAFKMTRPDCPVTALKGLLSEIKILTYLGKHKNIVSICGAYTAELLNGTVYVATELCPQGSLEKYLRSNGKPKTNYSNVPRYVSPPSGQGQETLTDLQLLRWSLEIASAMEFISSKNVIHADLATRNVLLTADLTAKVTDFGLSRRLYEYTEYVKNNQEPLPWRWMAIESLKQLHFSTKSDVWSYGITLWELFSLGDTPYPGLSWDVGFVEQLENGLRMSRPSRCPINIYETMTHCWGSLPSDRPSFETIKKSLQTIINLQSTAPISGE